MSEEPKAVFARSRGIQKTRVDSEGRLKFPSTFQDDFESLGEKEVFVSTLDKTNARIYTAASWAKAEAFFNETRDPAAKRIFFTLMKYGQNSVIDKIGRVMLKPELRVLLKLENQQVYLFPKKGYIDVYTESIYTGTEEVQPDDLAIAEELGLD